MTPDPKDESLRWLRQAENELEDAHRLASLGRYYLSLYLSQQSAEKALKAFIYLVEEELLFTHSVAALLKIASQIDPAFLDLAEAKRLDDYYIPTRYPNGLPGEVPATYYDDPSEAETALRRAEAVLKLAGAKIEGNP